MALVSEMWETGKSTCQQVNLMNMRSNCQADTASAQFLLFIGVFVPDEVAEWLRRWTANPLCSARVGSNPILVEGKCFYCIYLP